MASQTPDDMRLKELFKQALREVLEERRDILYDVFTDVVEDLALVNAIRQGEATEAVGRDEVFRTLESET